MTAVIAEQPFIVIPLILHPPHRPLIHHKNGLPHTDGGGLGQTAICGVGHTISAVNNQAEISFLT